MYETMAGKIPYEGRNDTMVFILVTVKKEFPERFQAIPNDGGRTDRLWKLLTMCWSFDPAARPSAAEVAESMRAIVSNAETPILRPTPINEQDDSELTVQEGQPNEQSRKLGKEETTLSWILDRREILPASAFNPPAINTTLREDTFDRETRDQVNAKTLPHPPKDYGPRLSAAPNENGARRESPVSGEEPSSTHAIDAARRAWANNLKAEWARRGAQEENHHLYIHTDPHPLSHIQETPTSSYGYTPASAEQYRWYQEQQEELKYRKRQAARAFREAREAAAARKAFEEERQRLEMERLREEDRRKNEEQFVITAWQRYEHGWQDLMNGASEEDRPLTFYDIPWPVSMPVRSFGELQSTAIERFLLSPYHSTTQTRKMRLSAALKQWHLDAFTRLFGDRLEESHRTAILTAAHMVMHTIVELRSEETGP
ncbi:unnamed protein product [Rhizoctonia solani]|uniref:Protein kinase domain-containing protein n=1 Tax=Rhizoctonia solani TaxID=456999 RepID=A0A8H3CHW9_9AGAM|nr:unnamed protein product [Rhizoctonia solani]